MNATAKPIPRKPCPCCGKMTDVFELSEEGGTCCLCADDAFEDFEQDWQP